MMPIKVVIADDHALFRDGLRRILSLEKDILVVGEAANGDDVIKVVERTKPDILLLDLKMPKGDVVQNLLEVGAKYPSTRVIILTAFSEEESVLNAATKLKKAAQMTACPGERTRVDTTVAMEFAASWNPLM